MRDEYELPETFDPSAHEGTGAPPPIPIGWYSAHIIESAVRDASNGNGTYLLAVFEILEGDYRGRKIFQNVTLQNASQQAVDIGAQLLTDIFTSVGHTGPTRDIRVMLFKPVKVRLGIKRDKDGIYPDRNAITAVKLPDYEPKQARASVLPPQAPKTPPVPPKGPTSPLTSAAPAAPAAPTASSGGSAPWR